MFFSPLTLIDIQADEQIQQILFLSFISKKKKFMDTCFMSSTESTDMFVAFTIGHCIKVGGSVGASCGINRFKKTQRRGLW
jgi:hypothetical protein